ncbi:hypothetical protein Ppa06_45670 [Planomonospora parontospora subsp. parontospora]|uniref:Uncharacterized protein n=2 Tax=Planomonospora parontospora TaxID=58119 RepID=A0AA37F742_9ACTN|nr:hypothetical protein GCM10010126_52860 [Planomonospora parontospora]GII10769.1 hypothetical protein Ppa06_45670 [Planomonospora parontospora subsp. parontospora]
MPKGGARLATIPTLPRRRVPRTDDSHILSKEQVTLPDITGAGRIGGNPEPGRARG